MTSANPSSGCTRTPSDCTYSTVNAASAEQQLEAQIKSASDRMCAAATREGKLVEWHEMVRLMNQRSVHYSRFLGRLERMR